MESPPESNNDVNQPKIIDYVNRYRLLGFTCIPTEYGGKKPKVEWDKYRTQQPTEEEYNKWFNNGTQSNIAAICGSASNNLLVLDFDKEGLIDKFFDKKDIRQSTLVVKTNRGDHVYLRTTTPTKTKHIPGVMDIIGEGHLVTLPPSKHPKGSIYTDIGKNIILEVDDLDDILWKEAEKLGFYKNKGVTTTHGRVTKLPDEIPPCILELLKGCREGGRNNTGFIIGVYLKNQGRTKDEILNRLVDWNKNNTP